MNEKKRGEQKNTDASSCQKSNDTERISETKTNKLLLQRDINFDLLVKAGAARLRDLFEERFHEN